MGSNPIGAINILMPHIHEKIDFVVVAFIVHNNKVLMVHHKELKMWLPVGGHIEPEEDPEEALFREIEEEAGLKPSDIEILSSKPELKSSETKFLFTPAFVDIHKISETHRHIGFTYFAKSKTEKIRLAEQEHHEIRWFTEEELDDPRYTLRPAIKFYAKEALIRSK